MPKLLFRQNPPLELTERILRSVGLLGLHDLRWFSKGDLVLTEAEAWLVELEPYYLPCMARRILDGRDADPDLVITVLRHVLEPAGYKLVAREVKEARQRHAEYQIQPRNPFQDLSGADTGVVEFL
jgi:hypothetical protein